MSTTLLTRLFKRHVFWKVIKIRRHVSGSRGMLLWIPILPYVLQFFIHLDLQCQKMLENLIQLVGYHPHVNGWIFYFHVERLLSFALELWVLTMYGNQEKVMRD